MFQRDAFTGEFVDAWKSTMASVKIAQVSLRRSNVYMYYQLAWAEYDGNTDLHVTLVYSIAESTHASDPEVHFSSVEEHSCRSSSQFSVASG